MKITVQDVMQALTLPGGNPEGTVDELLTGEAGGEVTGIVTAFMPTMSIIEQAARLGANLVVAHEMLYYAHRGGEQIHAGSAVCQEKQQRVVAAGVAVYRCHDYWHQVEPDGITEGLIQALGWSPHVTERRPEATIVEIPPLSLKEVADHVRAQLDIPFLRAMGDSAAMCKRIGVLAGFRGGGQAVIPLIEGANLDLVLYGEGFEWETPEYVRDARFLGDRRALLVLGHAESEEPGMAALADRLRAQFPGIPVHYLKEKPLFTIL